MKTPIFIIPVALAAAVTLCSCTQGGQLPAQSVSDTPPGAPAQGSASTESTPPGAPAQGSSVTESTPPGAPAQGSTGQGSAESAEPPPTGSAAPPGESVQEGEPAGGSSAPESSGSQAAAPPAPSRELKRPEIELLPPGSYQPAEWNGWQEDASVDKNIMIWDHVEYRAFGDPSGFLEWEDYLVYTYGEEGFIYSYKLPPSCFIDGVTCFNGGFKYEHLKIGEIAMIPYELEEGETITENSWHIYEKAAYNRELDKHYEWIQISADPHVIRAINTDRWPLPDGGNINVCKYITDLGNGYLFYSYFYVSSKATEQDIALYDYMAASIRVVT